MAGGNQYYEEWTFEKSNEIFDKAIALSETREYDFIGEVARDLKLYKDIFNYLVIKFPELKKKHQSIISNCEANCFYNGKKGNIVPSLAIMNLKTNHGWTDRIDTTTKGNELQSEKVTINFTKK